MSDQTITCSDCSNNFIFSEKDQAFYEEKGFSPPKRCRDCREARKQGGGSQGGYGGGGGGGQRRQSNGGGYGGGNRQGGGDRQMFPATCADCGTQTEVPFQPKSDRPVYCRDCFRSHAPRR